MTSYKLEPRPGFSETIVRDRPNTRNSKIVEYYSDSFRNKTGGWWPSTSRNLSTLDPKKPKKGEKGEKLVMRGGFREIKYGKPRDKLEVGINAYFQIIYSIVEPEQFLSFEQIYRNMVKDYGVLTGEEVSRNYLENLIEMMHERGHLLIHNDKYTTEVPLDGDNRYIDFKEGYDPIAYHIVKFVKNQGGVSRKELKKYIIQGLGLVENSETFDWYIDELSIEREDCKFLKNKVIEVKNGWVEKVGKLPNHLQK